MARHKAPKKRKGPRPPRPLLALRKRARRRQMMGVGPVLTTKAAHRLLAMNKVWKKEKTGK